MIVAGLNTFGIKIDEGPIGENLADVGEYGPYVQSKRKHLYDVFAKHFVAQGRAYPCRLSTEEIDEIRKNQQANKQIPGIYASFSKRRDASFDEQKKMIESGATPVIRFRSHGDTQKRVTVNDLIR